jgi:hypothetical protein
LIINTVISGPENLEMIIRQTPYDKILILSSALISILLIIIVKVFYKNYISSLFNLNLISNRLTNNNILNKESEKTSNSAVIILTVISGISITCIFFLFFIFILPDSFELSLNNPVKFFVIILASVFLYFGFKYMSIKTTGYVFDNWDNANLYISAMFNNIRLSGILIIPIYVCAVFVDEFLQTILIYSGFACLVISIISRIIKGLLLSFRIKLSIHYAILYLCGLEVFPLLIIIEYLRRAA